MSGNTTYKYIILKQYLKKEQALVEKLETAKLIMDSLTRLLPNIVAIFEIFDIILSIAALLNLPLKWQTPFYNVVQSYKLLPSSAGPRAINSKNKNNNLTLSSFKSTASFVPNLIQSLDANLVHYIIRSSRLHNYPLLSVHDSFLIHPNSFSFLGKDLPEAISI